MQEKKHVEDEESIMYRTKRNISPVLEVVELNKIKVGGPHFPHAPSAQLDGCSR